MDCPPQRFRMAETNADWEINVTSECLFMQSIYIQNTANDEPECKTFHC